MDLLIEKINHLQDICTSNNISHTLDLPQIVVIGSQSSGKSSVLESIVGRDFLPRGTGIVTRRPLILQLIYTKNLEIEFCIFNHSPTKFTDFNLVKKEIINETNREIQKKNDVSSKPITLKLYSSKVLTLTLIDLPGLVKIPTADQCKNICLKIEEMCRSFVINKNAIILAVSAANIDIANSDALQLARSVDPQFDRTIGVLTKVDLMDRGTDVVQILGNRLIKLRFGFVPVKGRSQADIDSNLPLETALSQEQVFFENHAAYKAKSAYCGTKYLVKKLNYILHEHIKACLPELLQKTNLLLLKAQQEFKTLDIVNLSPKETILKIIADLSKKFSDILNGNAETNENELSGGARLTYTFLKFFGESISQINPLETFKDEHIRTLLYNSSGSSCTIVFPQAAFEKLAKSSVKLLMPISNKLVSLILNELIKIIHQAALQTSLSRYPMLQEVMLQSLIKLFRTRADDTLVFVQAFINWNIDYINVKHPDFHKYGDIITSEINKHENLNLIDVKNKKINFDLMPQNIKLTGQLSKQEMIEIGIMKSFVTDYFELIKKIVVDQVPKAIMSQLVLKSEDKIQETLFKEVYEMDNVNELVSDSKEIIEKRRKLEETITALKQAHDIMCAL